MVFKKKSSDFYCKKVLSKGKIIYFQYRDELDRHHILLEFYQSSERNYLKLRVKNLDTQEIIRDALYPFGGIGMMRAQVSLNRHYNKDPLIDNFFNEIEEKRFKRRR